MKLLAIDSSGMVASVAIMSEDILIAEYSVNYKKTHSQTLMPMLDEIVKMTESNLSEFDYIAVAGGPGSFTGLRIGSATVKGLGMALDIPIVSVPTLEALAMNVCETDMLVCPIMDARRDQVYTGIYHFDAQQMKIDMEQVPMDIHELIGKLHTFGSRVLFLGDGVPVYRSIIEENLSSDALFAPAHLNRQRAAAVGMRAWDYVRAGKIQNAGEHAPIYLRLSQAERERLERENHTDV